MRLLLAMIAFCGLTLGAALASDSGPKADIAALRAAAAHGNATIENVRVVGNYAVLDWIVPPSGGMTAYKRASGEHWKVIMSGGGAFGATDLIRKGVPASVAHELLPGSP